MNYVKIEQVLITVVHMHVRCWSQSAVTARRGTRRADQGPVSWRATTVK